MAVGVPRWRHRRLHRRRAPRSKQVVQTFLCEWRPDYWISDRLGSQTGCAAKEQQFCLSHLIRDVQYATDEGDTVLGPDLKGLLKRGPLSDVDANASPTARSKPTRPISIEGSTAY